MIVRISRISVFGALALSLACGSADTTRGAGGGGAGGGGGAVGVGGAGSGGSVPSGAPAHLYFLDNRSADGVLSTTLDGSELREFGAGRSELADGVAVDAVAGHVYWTNMGDPASNDGFILRANLDGTNITTIIQPGGTYTPKQLRIDPVNGKLYWSDREGMRVMRANLDGSDIETLVTIATGDTARRDLANHGVGIAVDVGTRKFYWSQKGHTNGGVGTIKRASFDMPEGEDSTNRSDIEVLFEELPEPIDLALDIDAGMLYWTDRGDNTVNRAPMELPTGATAATRNDREILVTDVLEAIGLALDPARDRMFYTSLLGTVGSANLDGSNPTRVIKGSWILTGITMGPGPKKATP